MKKVMIDIGHGGSDPGAKANGLIEKDINLIVGLLIGDELKPFDCEVKFSRTTDITLSADNRVAIVKNNNPDLCVSVHHNYAAIASARGAEVIHAHYDTQDDLLANDILKRLAVAGMPTRRAFTKLNGRGADWYYMIRCIWDNDTDAIITEGGFLSNSVDALMLKKDIYLKAEAKAIAESIVDYLKMQPKAKPTERLLKQGCTGNDVKSLQELLNNVGYKLIVDGDFGAKTVNAVKDFQRARGLVSDGIVGAKTWSELELKGDSMKYSKIGTTHVIELDPMSLRISVHDLAANKIPLKNMVTPGFIMHEAVFKNGVKTKLLKAKPVSILASEGKTICNRQPHISDKNIPFPAGTLIVYKDGTVDVKSIINLNAEKDVWFAVGGCSILPKIRMKEEGFSIRKCLDGIIRNFSDIGRVTSGPAIGYNPTTNKVIIASRAGSNIARCRQTLLNLGCTKGIVLDRGGSDVLKVNGTLLISTTRQLYSVITWV